MNRGARPDHFWETLAPVLICRVYESAHYVGVSPNKQKEEKEMKGTEGKCKEMERGLKENSSEAKGKPRGSPPTKRCLTLRNAPFGGAPSRSRRPLVPNSSFKEFVGGGGPNVHSHISPQAATHPEAIRIQAPINQPLAAGKNPLR